MEATRDGRVGQCLVACEAVEDAACSPGPAVSSTSSVSASASRVWITTGRSRATAIATCRPNTSRCTSAAQNHSDNRGRFLRARRPMTHRAPTTPHARVRRVSPCRRDADARRLRTGRTATPSAPCDPLEFDTSDPHLGCRWPGARPQPRAGHDLREIVDELVAGDVAMSVNQHSDGLRHSAISVGPKHGSRAPRVARSGCDYLNGCPGAGGVSKLMS